MTGRPPGGGASGEARRLRAVIQRVKRASVTVGAEVVGAIDGGLLVLVGVADADGEPEARALADKLVGLRIFRDDEGRMNRSVLEAGGAVLVVSQFTLLADVRRGRRPSFTAAARPETAAPVVDRVAALIGGHGVPVATGRFGEMMDVALVNDGPVTLVIDVVDGKVQ